MIRQRDAEPRGVAVLDAAIVACALVDDGADGHSVRLRLTGPTAPAALVVPEGVDLRVVAVLDWLVSADRLSSRRAEQAVSDLADLPLERVPHWPFLDRAWQLRGGLTPLEATTLAIAEAFGATLIAGERRYGAVADARCPVELLLTDVTERLTALP